MAALTGHVPALASLSLFDRDVLPAGAITQINFGLIAATP
jgi:hypothetical protein